MRSTGAIPEIVPTLEYVLQNHAGAVRVCV